MTDLFSSLTSTLQVKNLPVIGFDTETTGVNPSTDRIVTAALIWESNDPSIARKSSQWLINPGVEIPASAQEVHGISTAKAQSEGADPRLALEEIANILANELKIGRAVMAFNASFDLSILRTELQRYQLATLEDRLSGQTPLIIDPLVLDRHFDRYRRGKRRLENLVSAYQVPLRSFHDAQADVNAMLDVWQAMLNTHNDLAQLPADKLLKFQQDAHASWAKNFTAFLQSKGRNDVIDPHWPYPNTAEF